MDAKTNLNRSGGIGGLNAVADNLMVQNIRLEEATGPYGWIPWEDGFVLHRTDQVGSNAVAFSKDKAVIAAICAIANQSHRRLCINVRTSIDKIDLIKDILMDGMAGTSR